MIGLIYPGESPIIKSKCVRLNRIDLSISVAPIPRLYRQLQFLSFMSETQKKKIAIIVRHETAQKCIGKGCLRAFNNCLDAFERYKDEDTELVAFCDDGGVSDDAIENVKERIIRFKKVGVDAVHVSTCIRARSPIYDKMLEMFAEEFEVVGYTHGSAVRKELPQEDKPKD